MHGFKLVLAFASYLNLVMAQSAQTGYPLHARQAGPLSQYSGGYCAPGDPNCKTNDSKNYGDYQCKDGDKNCKDGQNKIGDQKGDYNKDDADKSCKPSDPNCKYSDGGYQKKYDDKYDEGKYNGDDTNSKSDGNKKYDSSCKPGDSDCGKYDDQKYDDKKYKDKSYDDKQSGDKKSQGQQYEDKKDDTKQYDDKKCDNKNCGDKSYTDGQYNDKKGDDKDIQKCIQDCQSSCKPKYGGNDYKGNYKQDDYDSGKCTPNFMGKYFSVFTSESDNHTKLDGYKAEGKKGDEKYKRDYGKDEKDSYYFWKSENKDNAYITLEKGDKTKWQNSAWLLEFTGQSSGSYNLKFIENTERQLKGSKSKDNKFVLSSYGGYDDLYIKCDKCSYDAKYFWGCSVSSDKYCVTSKYEDSHSLTFEPCDDKSKHQRWNFVEKSYTGSYP